MITYRVLYDLLMAYNGSMSADNSSIVYNGDTTNGDTFLLEAFFGL